MRLEHYRKLYRNDARAFYCNFEQREVVEMLLDRFTINDWKEFEAQQKREGESS